MRQDKVYVCVKGPQPNATIDMALAINQVVKDFMITCEEVLQEKIHLVRVNHPFDTPEDIILNPNSTFSMAGVANGDILILS